MTDEQIIKALECCMEKYEDLKCTDCPLCGFSGECLSIKSKNAVDLINRQKTEIKEGKHIADVLYRNKEQLKEQLKEQKAEIERLQKAIKVQDIMVEQQDYKIKSNSEAIKEFAERLKKVYANHLMCSFNVINNEIDNVLNEMLPEPSKVEHDSLCETETYKGVAKE